jgi:hypothetical protein
VDLLQIKEGRELGGVRIGLHFFSTERRLELMISIISSRFMFRPRPGTSRGERDPFSGWRMNFCPSLLLIQQ